MGFGNEERPRNGIFGVLPAQKMGREPKNEKGGWGRGTPKIQVLGLSLLPNPTETLATQARLDLGLDSGPWTLALNDKQKNINIIGRVKIVILELSLLLVYFLRCVTCME